MTEEPAGPGDDGMISQPSARHPVEGGGTRGRHTLIGGDADAQTWTTVRP